MHIWLFFFERKALIRCMWWTTDAHVILIEKSPAFSRWKATGDDQVMHFRLCYNLLFLFYINNNCLHGGRQMLWNCPQIWNEFVCTSAGTCEQHGPATFWTKVLFQSFWPGLCTTTNLLIGKLVYIYSCWLCLKRNEKQMVWRVSRWDQRSRSSNLEVE